MAYISQLVTAEVGRGRCKDFADDLVSSRFLRTPPPHRRDWTAAAVAMALTGIAALPFVERQLAEHDARIHAQQALARLAGATSVPVTCTTGADALPFYADDQGGLLSSWQTIGGCGAGASTGAGGGIKWIGRGTTGGFFNVQLQSTYTRISSDPERPEHHAFGSAMITKPLTDRWTVGVSVPVVYKYMTDPFETQADLSNSGLGDISLLVTRKFGPIGATLVTATAGLPTGQFDGKYKLTLLNQSQQRGFGKPTASLTIDQVGDEIWGLTTIGASASYRGGENEISNYRAPNASVYGHIGYFLGPLVPAFGLSLSASSGHDRDRTVEQITGLYIATPSVSLEWSGDLIAIIVGASTPYQYDGILEDTEGKARSPWGFGPWMVGLGLSFSPF